MIKFTYKKDSGEVTNRIGIVLSKPNKNFTILDLSSIAPEELEGYKQLFSEYELARKELLKVFALDSFVKSFKPEGINDVVSI